MTKTIFILISRCGTGVGAPVVKMTKAEAMKTMKDDFDDVIKDLGEWKEEDELSELINESTFDENRMYAFIPYPDQDFEWQVTEVEIEV